MHLICITYIPYFAIYTQDMIQLVRSGHYTLIETKGETKILTLDKKQMFAWVNAENIGEILVTTHKLHRTDAILAIGKYRLYDVEDEPEYTDLHHLELLVGEGVWQGYLLPTGLPSDTKIRNRIIPTDEIITRPPAAAFSSFIL